jgi:hypothetical protein
MLGKMIIGLIAVAIVAVAPTVSASAKEKTTQQNTQQKKLTANIPKQVCETLTVDTKNWGEQTVQVCGPPGGPRGQASSRQLRIKPMAPRR